MERLSRACRELNMWLLHWVFLGSGCYQVYSENKTMLAAVLVMEPLEKGMLWFTCTSVDGRVKKCLFPMGKCVKVFMCLKMNSKKKKKKTTPNENSAPLTPKLVAFVCFCGVNITIMTSYKLSIWHLWTWGWKEMSTVCCVWASKSWL